MKINMDGLKDQVKPALNNAIKYLGKAENVLSSTTIPSDFLYSSQFRNLIQEISNVDNRINNIQRWLDEKIISLNNVENANKNVINNIISTIPNKTMEKENKETRRLPGGTMAGGETAYIDESGKVVMELDQTKIELDMFDDTEILTGAKENKEIRRLPGGTMAGGETTYIEVTSYISDKIDTDTKLTGAKISSFWEGLSNIKESIKDAIKTKVASIGNMFVSIVKGLSQFGEAILDLVVLVLAATGSIFTVTADGITYLNNRNSEDEENDFSITSKMWQNTMGFVAEDYVGNGVSKLYGESKLFMWLDDNAHKWFKSDKMISEVLSGIGYIGGIIILTIATAGIGGAATAGSSAAASGAVATSTSTTTAVSAGIATGSGIGKYTEEAWEDMRDSSFEGIKRMYQKGEIATEQYTSIVMIKSLSAEEWAEIEQDYKNGLLSIEEFSQMQKIREIPNDWKTFENAKDGILYGVSNGVWEGIQWYAGGKLANWTIKGGSKLATSAVRVGTDTAFNASDTAFRTATSTLINESTLKEAWEKQGGWSSVITDALIGLIGSLGGEVFDGVKIKNIENINIEQIGASKVIKYGDIEYVGELRLECETLYKGLDEDAVNYIKESLLGDHYIGDIDLDEITNKELKELIAIYNKMGKSKVIKYGNEEYVGGFRLNCEYLYVDLDEEAIKYIQNSLLEKHNAGIINLDKITNKELNRLISTYKDKYVKIFNNDYISLCIADDEVSKDVLNIIRKDENKNRIRVLPKEKQKAIVRAYMEKYFEAREVLDSKNYDRLFDKLNIDEKHRSNIKKQIIEDYVRGKTKLEAKNVEMQIKIYDAKETILDFIKRNYSKDYKRQRIKEIDLNIAAEKVVIFKDREEMIKYLVEKYGHTKKHAERILAFNDNGTVYLEPKSSKETIIHEIEHSLGTISRRLDSIKNIMNEERGMNEAFTELITNMTGGKKGTSGYRKNVEALEAIDNIIESMGYHGVLLESYYERDPKIYMSLIDVIAGEGFYENLAKQMEITTNYNDNYSRREIDEAYEQIKKLVNKFIEISGFTHKFKYKH